MKKLVVTTLLAGAMLSGFAGQADAAQPLQVQTKVIQVQDVNQLNQLLQQFSQAQVQYKNGQIFVQMPGLQPKAGQPKVDQPKQQTPVQAPKQNNPAPQQPKAEQPAQPAKAEQAVQGLTQDEQKMVDLVNQERQKQGLAPLKVDLELTKVARIKAKDMIDKNYFDHNSPTYGSPFDMMNQFGIKYNTAGENLAGNQTVEAAHQGLMNSQGHRANILNSSFKEVGIGVVEGGPYGKMFVQLFKG
ncbi:CAP domain-containing protein [Halalkalibacterium ligniniphilum]|uniref:CAP domain-containing protein n=1 Tax=Halalkalibacterium ligniniphilum TaxID=1134413 RepID=UPI00034584A9|nr:CAP domain-containing protein [Halalkalibacterium ligniniphilum]